VLGLRSAPPVFGVAEADEVARDLYGLAATVTALSGERDCNFQVRTASGAAYVLKIMDTGADPAVADCQWRALEHLAQQDAALPVPRVSASLGGAAVGHFDRDGVVFSTCLLSYLPGRVLSEYRAQPPLLEHLGRSLARLDGALQGFFHPGVAGHPGVGDPVAGAARPAFASHSRRLPWRQPVGRRSGG
jgi:Ser/Thr protein kinase RdoA (MazF antagonist)